MAGYGVAEFFPDGESRFFMTPPPFLFDGSTQAPPEHSISFRPTWARITASHAAHAASSSSSVALSRPRCDRTELHTRAHATVAAVANTRCMTDCEGIKQLKWIYHRPAAGRRGRTCSARAIGRSRGDKTEKCRVVFRCDGWGWQRWTELFFLLWRRRHS